MMSDATQRALRAVDGAASGLVATLRRWVEINSFTGNLEGVKRMGAQLEEDFAPLGMNVERHPGEGVGDHLIWRTPAWGPGGVLLVGHHDTVFPPGTFERFEEAEGRVRGPGVLDMKGGLLVVLTALAALAEAGALDGMRIAVVSVADEEIGSPTSRALIEDLARGARAGLVFEAGRVDDSVVTRRKGTGALTVTARGVAAHAGNAHAEGVNAIWALARLIDRMQRLTDYDRGVTVNVGTIKGGEAKNTVPPLAECRADFRFIRAPDGLELVAAVDRAAREIAADSKATVTITGGVSRLPLERTEASAALAALYAERAQRHGLGGGECPLVGGGSDANTVSAIGVPAIDGLGPRGRGFHTPNEYIEPATLAPRAKALVETLVALT
jgi:glutamate carboxypeptidase